MTGKEALAFLNKDWIFPGTLACSFRHCRIKLHQQAFTDRPVALASQHTTSVGPVFFAFNPVIFG
jgi:hypothetical protein